MYNELRNLQKSAKRGGATHKAKEKAFVESLDKTFDISHAESEVLIQNPEDNLYHDHLLAEHDHAQLGSGRGTSSMVQVDNKLAIKMQRKKEREDAIMSRAEREKVRKITSTANSEVAIEALDSESAESTDNENVESDDDTMTPKSKRPPRPKNIISPQVAAALDRTKISDRNAVYALASFS